ncbi:hypothetical protein GGR55DRAFT_630372 [Xylaria sp. FL0064]|nr:hypothetical protein GGR55DRAFT_630372 [Xylaria sp. FL0064]
MLYYLGILGIPFILGLSPLKRGHPSLFDSSQFRFFVVSLSPPKLNGLSIYCSLLTYDTISNQPNPLPPRSPPALR